MRQRDTDDFAYQVSYKQPNNDRQEYPYHFGIINKQM